mgnify:CR=1 FL=1
MSRQFDTITADPRLELVTGVEIGTDITHQQLLREHDAVIYADLMLLARVVDNLVRNAVQYNRPGGTVTISAEVEDNGSDEWTSAQTVLRVVDTGQGIPDIEREKVFERFYRVERSRNRRTGGAGLGLSIASEVVRLFQGTIRVAASSPEGTVIEVRMPGGRLNVRRDEPRSQPAAS